jgi:hypothetical protein
MYCTGIEQVYVNCVLALAFCLSVGVSLTQNSLYSEDLGNVAIVDTRPITLPEPVSVLSVSQAQANDEEEEEDDDFERPPAHKLKINFNPRATRPGRPTTNRSKEQSEARQDRRLFEYTLTVHRALGEITMLQLVESLDKEKPGLAELKRRLESISVRHVELERCKVECMKKPRSVVVNDPFYVITITTLDKCFKVLSMESTEVDAITVYSQTYSQEATEPEETVEGVKIGSGRDIEVMMRVTLLKDAATEGIALARWLERDVAAAVPSAQQQEIHQVAKQVLDMCSTCILQGFSSDFHFGMLPRIRPPLWFDDGIIRTFCERLSQVWPFKPTRVQFLDDPAKKRTRSTAVAPQKLSADVSDAIERYACDDSV